MAEIQNINEPLNFNDEIISGGQNLPFLKHLSQFFSIASFGIKIFLIYNMWIIFPSIDFKTYIKPFLKDEFFLDINTFIDRSIGWIGMAIISIEPLYQVYMKSAVYNLSSDTGKLLNFFQISYLIFPFIHGFVPQISFKLNNINVETNPNFFVQIFGIKTVVQNFFIVVIFCCIACVLFAICCGKGDKIGTWKTTTTYGDGRRSVNYSSAYGPDYDGAALYFLGGVSCGKLLVLAALLIFPLIVGMFAYVYNLCYMESDLLQLLYILEFCLNILYINFYTMYNIY